MKQKKSRMSNINIDYAIKETILLYFHRSKTVDEFINKCINLSIRYPSSRKVIKIECAKYKKQLIFKCQPSTSASKTSESDNNPKFFHRKKIKYKTLEERHERNGDKNVEMGFSSTGVPLPTTAQMKSHKKRKPFVRFIQVPMGGKSNRY